MARVPDLCGGLLIFAIVIAIVAVIGHVLWLMFAAVLKAAFEIKSDRRTLRCPSCDHELQFHKDRCASCGCAVRLPITLSRAGPAADFDKQLTRLLNRGVIE